MKIKGYQEIIDHLGNKLTLVTDKGIISIEDNDWRYTVIKNGDYKILEDENELIFDKIKVNMYEKMYKIFTSYAFLSKLGPVDLNPFIGNASVCILKTSPIKTTFSTKLWNKIKEFNQADSNAKCCIFLNDEIAFSNPKEDFLNIGFLTKVYSGYSYFVNVKAENLTKIINKALEFYNVFVNKDYDYSRKDVKLGVWAKLVSEMKECGIELVDISIFDYVDNINSLENIIRAFLEAEHNVYSE